MKRRILISINPEHVVNIINGTKKFEYRKITAKSVISSLVIYETTPIKKIVAEVEIEEILMSSPEDLWELTKKSSGINKIFFDEYFKGRATAYAYKLGSVKVYKKPRELKSLGIKNAPQSFVYL